VKRISLLALSVLFVLSINVLNVDASENPIDFKQSKDAWVVWQEYQGGSSSIVASQWEGRIWGKPITISSDIANRAPAIALDPAGNPWVVWSRKEGYGQSSIYYSRFNGEEWTPEALITPIDQRDDVTPAIAFNQNGTGIVAWGSVDTASSDIRVSLWKGQNWSEPTTLTAYDETPDMVPAVAFTASNKAVVTWVGQDEAFASHLYASFQTKKGKWKQEQRLNLGRTELGEDLPTFKVEGETLKLYFEEGNQFYASSWTGKRWTRKRHVDLSNNFYEVFAGLNGAPQGRAWFAWKNLKGISSSFRYNVVSHNTSFAKQASAFQYISFFFHQSLKKSVSVLAWVLGEGDAYAGGKKKKKKKPFNGLRAAIGDSITSGIPSAFSWVPFWGNGDVQVQARGGARIGTIISLAGRISSDRIVVVLMGGTNDIGDGRSEVDTINGLNSAAARAQSRAPGATVYMSTGTPRTRGASTDDLAQAIRENSAVPTIETFNPLNGNPSAFLSEDGLHLNEQGARSVGNIVGKAAQPR